MSKINRRISRQRIHRRIRKKISGTAEKPRLAVYLSNKNIYAQLIDDDAGRTISAASTLESAVGFKGKVNIESATKVGSVIAERAKAANVSSVTFDRGGFLFHGKVKALADAAREGGLQF